MADSMKRVSMSLPPDLVADLTYVSHRLGVSRSALVSGILREATDSIVPLLRTLPEEPTEADALRFRGESQRVVNDRVDGVLRLREDLFAGMGVSDD